DAVNPAQITSDKIKSCSGGSISQRSTDGSDNIVQLSLSGPSASCNIVQQNTTGQNSVQLDEVSQQSGGNNQSASQDAFVTQYNLSGLNNFQLSQSVRQSISETATNISESETSTQTYTAYQFNDTGANSSQVTQTLSQSESDTRATSGTQYQSATLQGHVDQHSHGQSTSKNSQSESQTQAAKSNGAVVQTQSGPLSCCSIQEDKNTDIF